MHRRGPGAGKPLLQAQVGEARGKDEEGNVWKTGVERAKAEKERSSRLEPVTWIERRAVGSQRLWGTGEAAGPTAQPGADQPAAGGSCLPGRHQKEL